MRAIEIDKYGPPEVLTLVERPTPRARSGEVVVKVHAVGTNPKDVVVRKGKARLLAPLGPPMPLGHDIAGEVVEVGRGVDLETGDRVYGMINHLTGRAYQELTRIDADAVGRIPDGLSYVEAAAVPLAAQTALQALRDCHRMSAGQTIVLHGASGGVGTFAVQIAKAMGAEVTATSSAANADFLRELGADHHVDYRATPPPAIEGTFDHFFDIFGNQSLAKVEHLLRDGGTYVNTLPHPRVVAEVARNAFAKKRAKLVIVRSRRADMNFLSDLIERGRMRPIVDRTFSLEDATEAHRYLETKRARGKVVLIV